METIGIVGSSHSCGGHEISNKKYKTLKNKTHTKFFTEMLNEHDDKNLNFINCAHAGKGTECFLENIIYLKTAYDISTLLIEVVDNRANQQIDIGKAIEEPAPIISSRKFNVINNSSLTPEELLSNTFDFRKYHNVRANIETIGDFWLGNTLSKPAKTWKNVQRSIAGDINMINYWTAIDTILCLKLCKLLGIKTVAWSMYTPLDQLPIFKSIIQYADIWIDFNKYNQARTFYLLTRGIDIYCDVNHVIEEVMEDMIKKFFLPSIYSINNL